MRDQYFKKPAFNWSIQDRYVELMIFEMEVTNILETVYELNEGEVPCNQELVRLGGSAAYTNIH